MVLSQEEHLLGITWKEHQEPKEKGYKFVFIYLPSGLWWRSNRNEAYDSGCLVVDLTIINQGRATISKECVNYEL